LTSKKKGRHNEGGLQLPKIPDAVGIYEKTFFSLTIWVQLQPVVTAFIWRSNIYPTLKAVIV